MRIFVMVILVAVTGCSSLDGSAYKASPSGSASQSVADRYGQAGSSRGGTAVRTAAGSSNDLLARPGRQ